MKKTYGAGLALLLLAIAFSWQASTPLRLPFNVSRSEPASHGRVFKCGETPQPPSKMSFFSVYDKNDPSRSVEDPEAAEAYDIATSSLKRFENRLTGFANDYIRSNGKDIRSARCAGRLLYDWAEQDALLGKANDQGQAVRKWSLGTLSSSYAQIAKAGELGFYQRYRIENWLKKIAAQVVRDYSTETYKTSRRNNHLYWAAWSVAMTGAVLNDPVLFHWGMDKGQKGLSMIDADGTLPDELNRKSRALHYHIFSSFPLVMLDRLARDNQFEFQKKYPGSLDALVHVSLEGLVNPAYFQTLTGTAQDRSRLLTPTSMAWLEIYDCENPLLNSLRPLKQNRIGGDATLLYSSCSVK